MIRMIKLALIAFGETFMEGSLDEIERVFLALSDKTRIRLVHLMSEGEVSVNYLCESLGISQPKVSRHLAYLRNMGLVDTRRDGKWIYYSLTKPSDPVGNQSFNQTLDWIAATLGDDRSATVLTIERTAVRFGSVVPQNVGGYPEEDISPRTNELEVYLL
jgi:DNA-binding transcriptional ArsR family regulator